MLRVLSARRRCCIERETVHIQTHSPQRLHAGARIVQIKSKKKYSREAFCGRNFIAQNIKAVLKNITASTVLHVIGSCKTAGCRCTVQQTFGVQYAAYQPPIFSCQHTRFWHLNINVYEYSQYRRFDKNIQCKHAKLYRVESPRRAYDPKIEHERNKTTTKILSFLETSLVGVATTFVN